MKVLILCSHRYYAPYTDYVAPFIYEQMQNLKPLGCEFQVCFVRGGGLMSYLRALRSLKRQIDVFRPDLIHAHYGLCCLVANMQRRIPVVSTFHGSDINSKWILPFSRLAAKLSARSIFVSEGLYLKAGVSKNAVIIPCGVKMDVFYPMEKEKCREQFDMDKDKKYILFSKAFNVEVKNYPLAKAAIDLLCKEKINITLVELKNYTRQQVAMLFNACDCALLTSVEEGSPQFIKEAMACNCPIVSVDVGDVKNTLNGVRNCYITAYDAREIAERIKDCLSVGQRSNDERIQVEKKFSADIIAHKMVSVYQQVIISKP